MISLRGIKYAFIRDVYAIIDYKNYNRVIKKLKTIPIKHWAEIWDKINSNDKTGYIDDVMPNYSPIGMGRGFRFGISIMDYIRSVIGYKECLMYNSDLTQKEFDYFYNKHLETIIN